VSGGTHIVVVTLTTDEWNETDPAAYVASRDMRGFMGEIIAAEATAVLNDDVDLLLRWFNEMPSVAVLDAARRLAKALNGRIVAAPNPERVTVPEREPGTLTVEEVIRRWWWDTPPPTSPYAKRDATRMLARALGLDPDDPTPERGDR
jgi:hypothetical protein